MRVLNKEETKAVSGGFFCSLLSGLVRFKVGLIGSIFGGHRGGYGHGRKGC